ncbi:hypothetical protein K438DRAFT_1935923 [Mycena galopus ATCC 62051]|nr:hypothetical protein K438DRAFT_1935923 [Mycena galopus ATCC 62051]
MRCLDLSTVVLWIFNQGVRQMGMCLVVRLNGVEAKPEPGGYYSETNKGDPKNMLSGPPERETSFKKKRKRKQIDKKNNTPALRHSEKAIRKLRCVFCTTCDEGGALPIVGCDQGRRGVLALLDLVHPLWNIRPLLDAVHITVYLLMSSSEPDIHLLLAPSALDHPVVPFPRSEMSVFVYVFCGAKSQVLAVVHGLASLQECASFAISCADKYEDLPEYNASLLPAYYAILNPGDIRVVWDMRRPDHRLRILVIWGALHAVAAITT